MGSKIIKTESGTWKHPFRMCRLCLSEESVEDIFKIDHLLERISDFLSIKITTEERMSRVICTICRIRLDDFHQFRIRCLDVQNVMQKMFEDADRTSDTFVKATTTFATSIRIDEQNNERLPDLNKTEHTVTDFDEKEIKSFISPTKEIDLTVYGPEKNNSQNSEHDENIPQLVTTANENHGSMEFQEDEIFEENYDIDNLMEDNPVELEDTIEVEDIKIETRDGDNEEGHKCDVCFKMYPTDKVLHRHKKIVHGPKNHKCLICNKAYTLRSVLTIHEYSIAHLTKLKERLKHQRNLPVTTNQIPKSKKAKLRLQAQKLKESETNDVQSTISTKGDGDGNGYACTKCSRKFKRQCQLDNHMKTHEKREEEQTIGIEDEDYIVDGTKAIPPDVDLKLPCDVCHKVFADKYKLYGHKKIHGKKRFHCPICERPFINGFLMKKHVETHKPLAERQKLMPPVKEQNEILETFSCDLCPKTYNRKRALMTHKKSKHEPKTHECEICGYKFPFRDNLTKHMRTHVLRRQTREDFEPIRMMQQKTTNAAPDVEKEAAQADSESNDDSDNSSSQPATTPKRTGLISALLMKKSDEQSFQCNVCQKSFEDYARLRSHKRIVHKARKHKCPQCERTYPYRKAMLIHMESHKSKDGPAEEFECGECHKIYSTFKALHCHVANKHIKKKAYENPNLSFDCSKCDRSFPTITQMKSHDRMVHPTKEYRCHICNQNFRIYVQLWQHMKHSHGTILKEFGAGDNCTPEDTDRTAKGSKDSDGDDDTERSFESSYSSKDKQAEKSKSQSATRAQPRRSVKSSTGDNFAEFFDSADSL